MSLDTDLARELAANRSSLIPAWRGSKGEELEVLTEGMTRSMPHSPSLPVLVSSLVRSSQEASGDLCCFAAAGPGSPCPHASMIVHLPREDHPETSYPASCPALSLYTSSRWPHLPPLATSCSSHLPIHGILTFDLGPAVLDAA